MVGGNGAPFLLSPGKEHEKDESRAEYIELAFLGVVVCLLNLGEETLRDNAFMLKLVKCG